MYKVENKHLNVIVVLARDILVCFGNLLESNRAFCEFMIYIPLANRVRGPYRKLRTEFFSSSIYGSSAKRTGHKSKGKKRGSVTYGTDRENEVSKIFVIFLVCV